MNADQWFFSKDDLYDTPTILDGKTFEEEQLDRIKGCHYIIAVGQKLNLSHLVVVTATTFFHRFFMRQSMARFHVYEIAATCLFVATKVEEGTRKLRDIITICAQKASKNDRVLEEDSKDYLRWKDNILYYELIVLDTLCFDLSIQHPQKCLLELEEQLKPPPSSIRKAWMLLYESLGSPLCVLYKPDVLAAAALLLASNFSSQSKLSENWYESLEGLDIVQMHETAADLLEYGMDHYLTKASSSSQSSSSQTNSPYASQRTHHLH